MAEKEIERKRVEDSKEDDSKDVNPRSSYFDKLRNYRGAKIKDIQGSAEKDFRDFYSIMTGKVKLPDRQYTREEIKEAEQEIDKNFRYLERYSVPALKNKLKKGDLNPEEQRAAYKRLSVLYDGQGSNLRSWYYNRKARGIVKGRLKEERYDKSDELWEIKKQLKKPISYQKRNELLSKAGDLYYQLGNFNSAIGYWNSCNQLSKVAELNERLGDKYTSKGQLWNAIKRYEEARSILLHTGDKGNNMRRVLSKKYRVVKAKNSNKNPIYWLNPDILFGYEFIAPNGLENISQILEDENKTREDSASKNKPLEQKVAMAASILLMFIGFIAIFASIGSQITGYSISNTNNNISLGIGIPIFIIGIILLYFFLRKSHKKKVLLKKRKNKTKKKKSKKK
jgi:tetratricopeptide (TPR) repeat protein